MPQIFTQFCLRSWWYILQRPFHQVPSLPGRLVATDFYTILSAVMMVHSSKAFPSGTVSPRKVGCHRSLHNSVCCHGGTFFKGISIRYRLSQEGWLPQISTQFCLLSWWYTLLR